jgi:hypothetical protein
MLSGSITTPLEGAFFQIAALTLEKQLRSLSTTEPAVGTDISTHWTILP